MNRTRGEWEAIETPSNDTSYAISCPGYDVDIAYIARYDINPPEVRANAHLIAAAPQMYEWIAKVASQDFIVFPEDKRTAKETLAKVEESLRAP